jgi:hypothetical protein
MAAAVADDASARRPRCQAERHIPDSEQDGPMPSIMVVTHTPDAGGETAFQLKERVSAQHLNDPHFSAQQLERIVWAVADAEHAERTRATGSDRR